MKYRYSARTKDGAIYRGTMDAKSQIDVVELLQSKDLTVVTVQEDVGLSIQKLSEINVGGVPMKEKVVFMRQLATMISAGLPLTQALQILQAQTQNPKFKKSLGNILADVEGGTGLADSFKRTTGIFDDITISLISAGEQSGHLDTILKRLALEIEKKKKLQDKIRSAFIYPAIILVVVVAVVVLLMVVLVPAMGSIYNDLGGELPPVTQLLISISNGFVKYWWLIIIVICFIGIGIKLYLDTDGGKIVYAKMSLKIPVLGKLTENIQITQFTRTLALLLKSGLAITEALRLTSESLSNLIFKNAVLTAKKEVEKGVPLAMPISRAEVFPLIVSQMVSVGEETGQLDNVLKKMSDYYEAEVNVTTENLSTLLEPVILILMAGVIGFIAVAVYTPMFSLSSVLGS